MDQSNIKRLWALSGNIQMKSATVSLNEIWYTDQFSSWGLTQWRTASLIVVFFLHQNTVKQLGHSNVCNGSPALIVLMNS